MRKLIFIILATTILTAAENGGSYLDNYPSARNQALGNAFVAVANDASAIFYNPAGVAEQSSTNIYFQDTELWGTNYLIMASNFNYSGQRFGLALLRGSEDSIREASLDALGIPYFTGNKFSWLGEGFYLSWAVAIAPPLTVTKSEQSPAFAVSKNTPERPLRQAQGTQGAFGITLKAVDEQMYNSQGHGWGLDVGYLYHWDEQITLGCMLENLVRPGIEWNTTDAPTEVVPLNIRLGSAYQSVDKKLLLVLDLTKKDYRDFELHGGVEYWVTRAAQSGFAVRAGLEPQAFNLGLGLFLNQINLDYAYRNSTYEDLGVTHRVSVGYKF